MGAALASAPRSAWTSALSTAQPFLFLQRQGCIIRTRSVFRPVNRSVLCVVLCVFVADGRGPVLLRLCSHLDELLSNGTQRSPLRLPHGRAAPQGHSRRCCRRCTPGAGVAGDRGNGGALRGNSPPALPHVARRCEKRISFAMPFCTTQNAIVLPRQARDKHRWKALKKRETRFSQGGSSACRLGL